MKRFSLSRLEAPMQAAPALVISFNSRRARLVPRERIADVTEGIITLSPLALFFLECRFVAEALADRARFRASLKTSGETI